MYLDDWTTSRRPPFSQPSERKGVDRSGPRVGPGSWVLGLAKTLGLAVLGLGCLCGPGSWVLDAWAVERSW
eukprot:4506254-Prymnesium_polylepis.1